MTRRSLRFRLLVAVVIGVTAALFIAGMSLLTLFEHHVERRIDVELTTYLNQITAGIEIGGSGRINFEQSLPDPRFNQPLSGLYWQVRDEARPTLLRSRSLWDDALELPNDSLAPGIVHKHVLSGPSGQTILVRERQIVVQPGSENRRIRVAVAVDRANLVEARRAFATDMLPYLATMAAVLFVAGWMQVRIGLAPLDAIRRGVMQIRSGATSRLDPGYPDEVMPLVDEMNGLLDAQEHAIERARAWTTDLAHGLKTPLTVLAADAQRLREAGNTSIADEVDQLAQTMRRRIDRELIRARVRSSVPGRGTRAEVGESVDRVVRTLKRTPAGTALDWSVHIPKQADAIILADDLTELLGNILENATKWARRNISVSVSVHEAILIRVEDDGPGVPDDRRIELGQRGVRLDQQKQGSGLGLAIARDIVEAYSGDLSFGNSPLGGLAVTIRLPTAE